MEVFLDLLQLFLLDGFLLAQRLGLGNHHLLAGGVFLLGDELGNLVLALLDALRLAGEAAALVVEADDAVHVGLDAAVVAVGFDGVEMVADEGGVEHEGVPVQRRFTTKTQRTQRIHKEKKGDSSSSFVFPLFPLCLCGESDFQGRFSSGT